MSPRNFTRVFSRETGVSPARYVAEARLAAARAAGADARDAGTHRHRHRLWQQHQPAAQLERQLHLTPNEYRQRFHSRKMA